MKHLFDVIRTLDCIQLENGEILYSFEGLRRALDTIPEHTLAVEDCTITPYYFSGGRRMELYWGELQIRLVDTPEFENYILRRTGKTRITDIPEEIILQQRICYCEAAKAGGTISKDRMQQYIQYLYHHEALKEEIQRAFGQFDIERLMLEVT